MKKIYLSYDVVADEIIDAFVRKNDDAAIRDFKKAFMQQSHDDTHVQLFLVHCIEDGVNHMYDDLEGIPCHKIWDSEEFEKTETD